MESPVKRIGDLSAGELQNPGSVTPQPGQARALLFIPRTYGKASSRPPSPPGLEMGVNHSKQGNDLSEDLSLILQRLYTIERLVRGTRVSPWMTAAEAADFLRISISTLDSLTARVLIPYRRVDPESSTSKRLFHRRDLVGYLVCGHNPKTHRLTQLEKKMVEELL